MTINVDTVLADMRASDAETFPQWKLRTTIEALDKAGYAVVSKPDPKLRERGKHFDPPAESFS